MILKFIDNFLNKITMYRLTLYCLLFLLLAAFMLSFFHILPHNPATLVFSTVFLLLTCLLTNKIFANAYKAPSNVESVYITAFILALIITPPKTISQLPFLIWASVFAISSKYILAIHKKHIFNPAAFAIVVTAFVLHQYASWWVGTVSMAPFVFAAGFLITRKIKRADLVVSFFAATIMLVLGYSFFNGQDIVLMLKEVIIYSPLMFSGFVMLTEPMTTPPKKSFRILYGTLAGVLFPPFVHMGSLYFSPELALITSNIFSYVVSPKEKLILRLKEKTAIAKDTYDFVFHSDKKLKFKPGQYLEWTLAHKHQDSRGIRRYFSIASSPTESDIRIGVKFYDKPSSYKKYLESLRMQDSIVASQLAGEFTMPEDKNKKLIFIAGGIGITPFRSMIKYLLDNNEKRDIVIFYSNNTVSEISYKEIFDKAEKNLGIKIIYTLTNLGAIEGNWQGKKGFVDRAMILKEVADYKERMFYISGPRSMIVSFESTLKKMDIPKTNIKTDFFPGFA